MRPLSEIAGDLRVLMVFAADIRREMRSNVVPALPAGRMGLLPGQVETPILDKGLGLL